MTYATIVTTATVLLGLTVIYLSRRDYQRTHSHNTAPLSWRGLLGQLTGTHAWAVRVLVGLAAVVVLVGLALGTLTPDLALTHAERIITATGRSIADVITAVRSGEPSDPADPTPQTTAATPDGPGRSEAPEARDDPSPLPPA